MSLLELVSDKVRTVALKARYQRIVHERLLRLASESSGSAPAEDPGRWLMLGQGSGVAEPQRRDARTKARQLVTHNPHARNILRLLEAYVTGPGLVLDHRSRDNESSEAEARRANRLWAEFLEGNERHYSHREHARRTWRDGECFIRKFSSPSWPPQLRFIDPEAIGSTPEHPDSEGILHAEDDVETPVAFLRIDPNSGRLEEEIDGADVYHTRAGVDSNQKRGVSVFLPVLTVLDRFEKWVDTELLARKLQSSIVLWRKVQGSPQQAAAFADAQGGGTGGDSVRREPVRPGTILTTNEGTDIRFLQPDTNFTDAVPLGRMLLLCTAAGAGLPEFMLTSDASNANFASTMVAEGPAVKLFQNEQSFFTGEFTGLWRWVMSEAVAMGLLPRDFFARVEARWSFPQLVNRDRPRERLADVRLVESRILSRAEIARRDGADPVVMRTEMAEEDAGTSRPSPTVGGSD